MGTKLFLLGRGLRGAYGDIETTAAQTDSRKNEADLFKELKNDYRPILITSTASPLEPELNSRRNLQNC